MRAKTKLWGPGYLVAGFLVMAPITDLALRLRPWDPTNLEWRYGAAGFVSLSLEAPLLGLFLAMLVAAVLGHRRVLQFGAVLTLLTVAVFAGLAGVFMMDARMMRSMVNPAILRSFEISALVALAKYTAVVLIVLTFGTAGWRLGRRRG